VKRVAGLLIVTSAAIIGLVGVATSAGEPAALVLGVDAQARPSAPPSWWERVNVTVRPRKESPPSARTTSIVVPCAAPEWTAVHGHVKTRHPDLVVVGSHAVPPAWSFELTNYGTTGIAVALSVRCVKGARAPRRYFVVLRQWAVLEPGQKRKAEVTGPRFASPLGFGFRTRSLEGSDPPPGDSRVQILTAQPKSGGYGFEIQNTGSEAVRVEAGAIFVRTRASGRTVARTQVVSATRSAEPGQSAAATVRCPAGSAAVASGWSFPGPELSADATFSVRDFRFRASNNSDFVRRVRFFGICLT